MAPARSSLQLATKRPICPTFADTDSNFTQSDILFVAQSFPVLLSINSKCSSRQSSRQTSVRLLLDNIETR
jgi:hypothetical protein